MSKGQFGARDLQKHLWKLLFRNSDATQELPIAIAEAGATAAAGAGEKLAVLRKKRTDKLTMTVVRRELRKWLRTSEEGRVVETRVGRPAGLRLGAAGVAVDPVRRQDRSGPPAKPSLKSLK